MENKVIVEKLHFLISEYSCAYTYENDIGDLYYFTCELFKVNIYEFMQFNDLEITLIIDNQCYDINPSLDKPKEYYSILKKRKGIKGWFYFNYEQDFWDLVAKIIKEKILSLIS